MKSILNSIFHQDSSVLKLLADKKVYESEQKKTTTVHVKQDMLDLVATSDNFFVTGPLTNWFLWLLFLIILNLLYFNLFSKITKNKNHALMLEFYNLSFMIPHFIMACKAFYFRFMV